MTAILGCAHQEAKKEVLRQAGLEGATHFWEDLEMIGQEWNYMGGHYITCYRPGESKAAYVYANRR